MPTKFIDIKDINGEVTTVNVNIIGKIKPEVAKPGFSPKKAFIYFNDGSGKITVDMESYNSVHAALVEPVKAVKKTATRKTTTAASKE